MMTPVKVFSVFVLSFYVIEATPVVLQGLSPLGDTVIAISSSNPDIEKFARFDFPTGAGKSESIIRDINRNMFDRSFSFASPGNAAAGSGRSFVSTSNFDPFSLPFFFMPINYENFGLGNLGSWLKNLESVAVNNPTIGGNGEIKTVTAVNDNGHVYGKVKTVTFDNQKGDKKM